MKRDFFASRECWFVGNFSTHSAQIAVTQAQTVLSINALSFLRLRPKAVFIGQGADVFGRAGSSSWPDKADACHVIVLLGTCTAQQREEVDRYAKRHGIPVLEHTAIGEIVECYFVPSAWEAKLVQ